VYKYRFHRYNNQLLKPADFSKVRKKAGARLLEMGINKGHTTHSQIFKWVSTGRKDITLDIHPKSKDEIDNKRRAHGEKGNINKPGPDT